MLNGPLERILAVRLRELSLARRLGVKTLARRAAMSETSVRRLRAGQGSPTLRTLQRLAQALGVEPLLLLRGPLGSVQEEETAPRKPDPSGR